MLRAVLDTNIIVSAIVSSGGSSHQILEAWRQDKFIFLTSEAIIAEVVRVLHYPHLSQKFQISEADIQAVVASLSTDAYLLEDLYEVQHSRDPDDDIFLGCSLEGKADYLVSGDTHLLEIKYYHGTQIVNSRDFIKILSTISS
jgi:putative PIN family toxin of toxin-antitoxin system